MSSRCLCVWNWIWNQDNTSTTVGTCGSNHWDRHKKDDSRSLSHVLLTEQFQRSNRWITNWPDTAKNFVKAQTYSLQADRRSVWTQNVSEDEGSRSADLGLAVDVTGLDFRGLLHGHGGLEGHVCRRAGWEFYHHGGLVLVQFVEGMLHRLRRHIQLLRLSCALGCRRCRHYETLSI